MSAISKIITFDVDGNCTSESQYLLTENGRGMKLNITEYCVKKREFSLAKKFVVLQFLTLFTKVYVREFF